jgi:hypothetical protein
MAFYQNKGGRIGVKAGSAVILWKVFGLCFAELM